MSMMRLSRNQIKLICTVYMVFAHILFGFYYSNHILFRAVYTIGEFVPVLFIYFMAEGYTYTSNKIRYGIRLLMFGILTQPLYYVSVVTNRDRLNIVITFAVCVFLFCIYEREWNVAAKVAAYLPLLVLIKFCEGDYLYFAIAIIFFAYKKYNKTSLEAAFLYSGAAFILYYVVNSLIIGASLDTFLYFMGCVPGIMIGYLLLKCHYDPSIRSGSKAVKYAFYVAYPAHFVLLAMIHVAQYYGYLPKAVM